MKPLEKKNEEKQEMTTTQYAQAITEAYQAYVALYNSNAPLAEQEAQFNVYQQLIEAYNASK